MPRRTLPPLSLALTVLRSALGWSQAELARAAGVLPNAISDYERGHRTFQRDKLDELASVMGLPLETVGEALDFVRSVGLRAWSAPPCEAVLEERRQIEAIAVRAGRLYADFTRSLLSQTLFESRILADRQQAPVLWRRLQRHTPSEQRMLIEESLELRSWALCELLCKESSQAAADNVDRACELANLALFLAELVPGEEVWQWRLQGYAWAHVGNARRVRGDLLGAEAAFARSAKLWDAGAPTDPELLDEALVLSLEASTSGW
jgi:transcriptional regulator with XRE-family HTH domain